MMTANHFIVFSVMIAICSSQRSPYAGRRPIGFPIIETATSINALGNKFGENDTTTTTQRLPIEALGDRELVNRLGQLPQDKQPFWLLNWQALEDNRKSPQSYNLRPSAFADSISTSQNTNAQKTPQSIPNEQNVQNLQQNPLPNVNQNQNLQPNDLVSNEANNQNQSNFRPL